MTRRPRWTVWLCAGLGTVALHGCLLDAVWPASADRSAVARAVHVRTVPDLAMDGASVLPNGVSDQTVPSATPLRRMRPTSSVDASIGIEPRLVPVTATVDATQAAEPGATDQSARVQRAPMPDARADADADADATTSADAEPAVEPAADPAAPAAPQRDSVPTYRTAPPPATRLSYDLKHGILTGQGEIDWAPAGQRYQLKLEGRIASLTLLTQISSGGFDAHGLAPERYTDQRMKRSVNAANLQRGINKITFSGPDTQFPLLPGTQDRVSWMVQLASIVNAQPELATPGAQITLFVVGARGEGDVWVFSCVGSDTVETGMGRMPAVKFMREPTKPHDTQVEAWLAPQLHGLPAHARLSNGNDGALDLILRDVH